MPEEKKKYSFWIGFGKALLRAVAPVVSIFLAPYVPVAPEVVVGVGATVGAFAQNWLKNK